MQWPPPEPLIYVDGVFRGGGKFGFGRAAVIDRDDDKLAYVGELSAHDVMGVEVADHPAAAVKEHKAWRQAIR